MPALPTQVEIQRLAERASLRAKGDVVRRKCFISYHHVDAEEVASFVSTLGDVFIAKIIGITDDDPFVGSTDRDYIMRKVREKYLTDSTVTVVLLGSCTWARRFVDWEIASTLRNDTNNKRSGLMGITLPSYAKVVSRTAPPRLSDNVLGEKGDEGYARWWKYPTSGDALRGWIEIAYAARTARTPDNSRLLYSYNRTCP